MLSSTLELRRQPPQCFLYETCDRLVETALEDCPIGRENTIGGLLPDKATVVMSRTQHSFLDNITLLGASVVADVNMTKLDEF